MGVGTLKIRAEKGCDIGTSLGDNKVVDVEELGDAGEWRVAVCVAGLAPGAEGGFLGGGPGDDGACFVFAFERYWGVEGC